jgi:mono/diheme cytochrome c family protein
MRHSLTAPTFTPIATRESTMRRILAFVLIAAPAVPAAAQETGAMLYAQYCATCHGVAADGEGPMAPILMTPPSDLTGLTERAGGSFPTFGVVQRIDGRDSLLAHGGEMPLWGDVFGGEPAASLATEEGQPILTTVSIAALVEYLESVQR